VGKRLLMKFLLRQQVQAGNCVVVLDCETTEEEYAATLIGDLAMDADGLGKVHYVTDDQRSHSRGDRWSGKDKHLGGVLAGIDLSPSLVLVDSQSKSMALGGLDENRALQCGALAAYDFAQVHPSVGAIASHQSRSSRVAGGVLTDRAAELDYGRGPVKGWAVSGKPPSETPWEHSQVVMRG
jgi:hypothetical protein